MLRELFQIREQRKGEVDISISLSVTEIYNEMIKARRRFLATIHGKWLLNDLNRGYEAVSSSGSLQSR